MYKIIFLFLLTSSALFSKQNICVEGTNLLDGIRILRLDICVNTGSTKEVEEIKHILILNIANKTFHEVTSERGKETLLKELKWALGGELYLTKFSIYDRQ